MNLDSVVALLDNPRTADQLRIFIPFYIGEMRGRTRTFDFLRQVAQETRAPLDDAAKTDIVNSLGRGLPVAEQMRSILDEL